MSGKMDCGKFVLLVLFVSVCLPSLAHAEQSYGEMLCTGDTLNYYCLTVEEKNIPVLTLSGETAENNSLPTIKTLDTWESLWPDEREREIVRKVNRINVILKKGMILAVPCDMQGKTFMDFSPYPEQITAPGEKLLIWDPQLLAFAAYSPKGTLIRWGPGVGGKDWCADVQRSCRTKVGEFKILQINGANYHSSRYPVGCSGASCAPMAYAMFFATNYAFHSGNLPGKNASHGCVRVFDSDAQWLNQNFVELNLKVIIKPYPITTA